MGRDGDFDAVEAELVITPDALAGVEFYGGELVGEVGEFFAWREGLVGGDAGDL